MGSTEIPSDEEPLICEGKKNPSQKRSEEALPSGEDVTAGEEQ
jgi:hypothetical protein